MSQLCFQHDRLDSRGSGVTGPVTTMRMAILAQICSHCSRQNSGVLHRSKAGGDKDGRSCGPPQMYSAQLLGSF